MGRDHLLEIARMYWQEADIDLSKAKDLEVVPTLLVDFMEWLCLRARTGKVRDLRLVRDQALQKTVNEIVTGEEYDPDR